MRGRVNEDFEAVVAITVRHRDQGARIDAVVNTGFSEFLTLPTSLLVALGAHWRTNRA